MGCVSSSGVTEPECIVIDHTQYSPSNNEPEIILAKSRISIPVTVENADVVRCVLDKTFFAPYKASSRTPPQVIRRLSHLAESRSSVIPGQVIKDV